MPPDIVVGGLRFYRESVFYLLSFFVSYSPSSLNGTQQTSHMLASGCDFKMCPK